MQQQAVERQVGFSPSGRLVTAESFDPPSWAEPGNRAPSEDQSEAGGAQAAAAQPTVLSKLQKWVRGEPGSKLELGAAGSRWTGQARPAGCHSRALPVAARCQGLAPQQPAQLPARATLRHCTAAAAAALLAVSLAGRRRLLVGRLRVCGRAGPTHQVCADEDADEQGNHIQLDHRTGAQAQPHGAGAAGVGGCQGAASGLDHRLGEEGRCAVGAAPANDRTCCQLLVAWLAVAAWQWRCAGCAWQSAR